MKISVINGNLRHGSTWNCKELLLKEIEKREPSEVTEWKLPNDMPFFCRGCFSCFLNGEDTCPDAQKVQPIVQSILEADLIILTSPVYAMDVSGQMKTLLDHLCYMWMSHRPDGRMFSKTGLTIVTTAGAGLSHTTKTLRNSLVFWGLRRVYSFRKAVAAMSWAEVPEQKKAQISRKVELIAGKIVRTVRRRDTFLMRPFQRVLFAMMALMMKNNKWNPRDREHWVVRGWTSGKRPF
jgi:multimeric flavodoxin WrbA